MNLNPFHLHSPQSLKEALSLWRTQKDIKILAGGTFLLNRLKFLKKKGLKTPENILSLRKISELKGIETSAETLTIGSMATLADIADSVAIPDELKIFKSISRNIATNPIRNMATVGGNLTCRYTWTEFPGVCMALDAEFIFITPDLKTTAIKAQDFFSNQAKTNDILKHIVIPRKKKKPLVYKRAAKNSEVDIPLFSLSLCAQHQGKKLSEVRAVYNNGSAFAKRDTKLEQFLESSPLNKGISQEALKHVDPSLWDDRNDDYKQHLARVQLKNAIDEMIGDKTRDNS